MGIGYHEHRGIEVAVHPIQRFHLFVELGATNDNLLGLQFVGVKGM
jgi:hypothetical protein